MPKVEILETAQLDAGLLALLQHAPLPSIYDEGTISEVAEKVLGVVKSAKISGSLLESALWLLAGDLDRSHSISQQFDSAEGSFWHGIMHRREGDYGNAGYWFRRVGSHPVQDRLREQIADNRDSIDSELLASLLASDNLAEQLIIACREAQHREEWRSDLERICWWEWELLFDACA